MLTLLSQGLLDATLLLLLLNKGWTEQLTKAEEKLKAAS